MRSRTRFAAILAALLLALTLQSRAVQQPQSLQTPRFGAVVDLIQVDVSVLDKQRRPIAGLAQTDFTVFEDGEPQTIAAFSAVDIPEDTTTRPEWMSVAPADVVTNQIGERRLFVILMDDRGSGMPLHTTEGKRAARAAVDQIGPNDQAAVTFMECPQDAEEFTSDRARLYAAIERFETCNKIWMSPTAVTAMSNVATALSTVPDRRKTLIYIGNGESLDPKMVHRAISPVRKDPLLRGGVPGQGLLTDIEESPAVSVFGQLQDLVRRAQRANVNIYGVSTLGLGAGSISNDFDSNDFLVTVSDQTGGRAIINNNTPAAAVPRIFTENGSYYLLGFRSTNAARDGRLRRLDVKVNRPGVEVRARTGYVASRPDPIAPTATPPPGPLDNALARIVPLTDLPMSLAAAAFRNDESGKASLAVTVGVPTAQADGPVEVMLSLYGEDGKLVTTQRGSIPAAVRTPFDVATSVQAQSRMDLAPGRYGLRASAFNPTSGKSGSVYATATVPNFSKDVVSLSDVVLQQTPSPPSTSTAMLRGLLPVAPTIARQFRPSSQVVAFARLYQGGKNPGLTATITTDILDEHDAIVFSQTDQLQAERFKSSRGADYLLPVPVDRLQPGRHVLRITAAVKVDQNHPAKRVVRHVPFEVNKAP